MSRQYDIAAFIWPSYHPDPRARVFWPMGIGEWEMVMKNELKFEGHDQPRLPAWGYVNEADRYVMQMQIDAAGYHGVRRHSSTGRSQAAAVPKERREPALARREGGPASPTWSVWLPRAGSATIHPSHPSASVHPRSRSPSCPYPPNRAAPPHSRQPFR